MTKRKATLSGSFFIIYPKLNCLTTIALRTIVFHRYTVIQYSIFIFASNGNDAAGLQFWCYLASALALLPMPWLISLRSGLSVRLNAGFGMAALVPLLILIYILRSKYNEQTGPSTYLWHLSEKFLKRRNPLSGLTGLISLILQILLVALLSLALARPVITLPGAARDYHFLLDSSASMSTVSNIFHRLQKSGSILTGIIATISAG